jgi:hypothetical protein
MTNWSFSVSVRLLILKISLDIISKVKCPITDNHWLSMIVDFSFDLYTQYYLLWSNYRDMNITSLFFNSFAPADVYVRKLVFCLLPGWRIFATWSAMLDFPSDANKTHFGRSWFLLNYVWLALENQVRNESRDSLMNIHQTKKSTWRFIHNFQWNLLRIIDP